MLVLCVSSEEGKIEIELQPYPAASSSSPLLFALLGLGEENVELGAFKTITADAKQLIQEQHVLLFVNTSGKWLFLPFLKNLSAATVQQPY